VQSLTVPPDHNPGGHTPAEILDALQGVGGRRRFSFRYDLLDRNGAYVAPLPNVVSCSIEQNWLADIKRTARITLRDSGGIDYLSDRIQPWVRLHLPPYGPDDWVEWPQGVFLLSSPTRSVDQSGVVLREVEAYDLLQIYADDLVDARYTVPAGTPYIDAIRTLLAPGGTYPFPGTPRISPTSATVPIDREWDPGTSRLRIINDLLAAINYESLSFDEYGVAVVRPYVSPDQRAPEYTYGSGPNGVTLPDVEQTLDLFAVPNRWVLVVSEPEEPPLVATYTNSNPSSPTSTVRRGRVITDFRTEQEAADLATLQARAARLAFEASQIYEAVEFATGLMPIHSGNDVYQIVDPRLSINARYVEHSWSMDLRAGSTMRHRARRVVTV